MNPLPAHWASRDGLLAPKGSVGGGATGKRIVEPRSVVTARQKASALSSPYDPASFSANAVDVLGAQRPGLVKTSTSQTDQAPKLEGVIEFTAHEGRMRRMARSVKSASRVHKESAGDQPAAMFTLTHRPGEKPEPKDVTRFVDCLRKWCMRKWGQKTLRYVWVAELQAERAAKGDAGAVHYHVAVWLPPALKRQANKRPHLRDSHVLPKPDRKGWWKKGSTERDWVRKSVTAYLAKYLSKGGEVGYPKALRVHGAGGFSKPERLHRSHLCLPQWLREQVGPDDRCVRLPAGEWVRSDGHVEPGGGWISRKTGECYRSPWVLLSVGRIVRIVKRVDLWNQMTAAQASVA